METTDFLPVRVARAFDGAYAPVLASPDRPRSPDVLDILTRNIYDRLPSGDYGRGDVRDAILAVWGFDRESWDIECERMAANDAKGEA